MKAYQLSEFGIDRLRAVDIEQPKPGPDDVLVRVRAISLNYRDLMVVKGQYNPRMRLPSIPFSDAAGEVVEVGSSVETWKVGDKVCSTVIPGWIDGGPTADASRTAIGAGKDGVLQEYRTFQTNALVAAPAHLNFEEASTLPCAALTAWHALVASGRLKEGDSVLTLGTGGVSVFAAQFAASMGARVLATSSSDQKLEHIRNLGAAETINYRATPDWDKEILNLTGGIGVDHVVEVGGTGTLSRSIKSVRTGGHIALIGALDTSGEFHPVPIFMKGIRVQGIFVGSREMFVAMNDFISREQIRPALDKTFEFDSVMDALKYMESGSHFGKIVVRVGT